jgi:Fe-S cluster assembly protein SufD
MISLNAALATDGVVLAIRDGAQLSAPVQIIHVATAASASAVTRSQVRIGNGVRATLIESFAAAGAAGTYQVHDAVILSIGDDADVAHIRLMDDAPDAVNISSEIVTVGARTKLNFFNMTTGAAVSRLQGFITLAGESSTLSVNGVNLLKKTEHGDTTLVVDHAVPGCTSREVFRAVIDDRSHSVFQGRIIVRPDAQKTDGKMMTRALLLSDEAEADNKPELEIFADDVSCGHGATAGALDDSLLFYLRARGLPEKEAQALLIQAFVGEAIEEIADDGLREHVIGLAERWLEARK